jgi:hypothetical protein
MSSSRTFIKRASLVLLLVTVTIATIFIAIQPDENHYFQSSVSKLNLLKTTPSPRIILIGGSNVSFGIDSQLMKTKLGVPVINYGLHGGLGVTPLRELHDYIKEDDIIIISLEYTTFGKNMNGNPRILSDWIEFSPERIKYLEIPWKEAPNIYLIMLQQKVNRKINLALPGSGMEESRGIYTGNHFNEQGDFIGHLDKKSLKPKDIPSDRYPIPIKFTYDHAFTFLYEFNQYATTNGAKVYFEAQSSRQTNCTNTGIKRMERFYKVFKQRTKISVLTPMDQLCLPDKYFFDTPYHLNAQGRQIRTERLIIDLQKTLGLP